MIVRDLIQVLQDLPQGTEIFLAADAEGNSYSKLDALDVTNIRKDEIYHGRYQDDLIYDDELEDWEPEDVNNLLEPTVVFWPV